MDNQNLFISFSPHNKNNPVNHTSFANTLKYAFPSGWDFQFYTDTANKFYINGIPAISDNFETTLEYLKTKTEKYKKVVFIGASAGGYAATLFGSLLNVNTVISFYAPTILNKNLHFKHLDLKHIINNTTKYFLYGDTTIIGTPHCISQQYRVDCFPNVKITKIDGLFGSLPKMRDNGELHKIIIDCCKD